MFVRLRLPRFPIANSDETQGKSMNISDPHIAPIVALIAGILILIVPRLLSFIVAVYLIIIGLNGLNAIHHFIR
jgi:hypothetical protein